MQSERASELVSTAWQTANFTGAAFAGKLRKLSHYKKDGKKANAPKIGKEEFEDKLAKAKAGVTDGS